VDPLRAGDRISSRFLNNLARGVDRLQRLRAAAPLFLRWGHGVPNLSLNSAEDGSFYAILTSRAGTAYGWQEVYLDPNGPNWILMPGGRSGTTSTNPAYEFNLAVDIPASPSSGEVVKMYPGAPTPADFRFPFNRQPATPVSGCSPCQPPLADLTFTIRYYDNSVHPAIISQAVPMTYRSGLSAYQAAFPGAPSDHNVWNTACMDFLLAPNTANSGDTVLWDSKWVFELFCNRGSLLLMGYGYLYNTCNNTYSFPCCSQYPTYVPNLSASAGSSNSTSITGQRNTLTGFTPAFIFDSVGSTCSPLHLRWTGNTQSSINLPWVVDVVVSH
jgi:hypothetical protein